MALHHSQKKDLWEQVKSFLDKKALTRYVFYYNGTDLEDEVNLDARFEDVVFEFIDQAEKNGYLTGFLEYLELNHPNQEFKSFLDTLLGQQVKARRDLFATLNVTKGPDGAGLEKMLKDGSGFVEVGLWLDGMSNYLRWVCRIDYPVGANRQGGTGLLVDKDLVLTNFHVLEHHINNGADPTNVTVTFDFAAGAQSHTAVKLAPGRSWLIDHSIYSPRDAGDRGGPPVNGELDFALIRLERAVDTDVIAGRPRGSCKLKKPKTIPVVGSAAFILQHPDLQPMKLAFGQFQELNGNSTRLKHGVDTDGGSSGSPCLDADLNVVALHHGGDPYSANGLAEYNQAIPMGLIIDRWEQQQITPFWS